VRGIAWSVPDFLGYPFGEDVDVLVVLHWCAKVVVFDVDAQIAGPFVGVRDGAVDV
jgi:hypothetical protein